MTPYGFRLCPYKLCFLDAILFAIKHKISQKGKAGGQSRQADSTISNDLTHSAFVLCHW